ncbi:MAG: hypothetical protein ACK5IM_04890 [Demequina sp.]|uniref:hypothetical protein n=1 Tax=Demequina sp. TaxID=2050685 RepID=UPI003A8820CF
MPRLLLTSVIAAALACAGCASSADVTVAAASTAAGDTTALSAERSGTSATADPAVQFWSTVAAVEEQIGTIIAEDIGRTFHERIGGQDTAVALSTVAETELGWALDEHFAVLPDASETEDILVRTLNNPSILGAESDVDVRKNAFVRYGSDDAGDYARDMCRTLTDGSRAELVAAIADASDTSRTDPGSPSTAGAGLAVVVCPEMTDEYLAALNELAATA